MNASIDTIVSCFDISGPNNHFRTMFLSSTVHSFYSKTRCRDKPKCRLVQLQMTRFLQYRYIYYSSNYGWGGGLNFLIRIRTYHFRKPFNHYKSCFIERYIEQTHLGFFGYG